ncbi:MAG: sirohydrochlorin cobaltochelatase [Bacteroidales bacterium]|nr:sirohydrochlorin cobaltochelatase [Bacteroidales bacterium]
MKQILALIFAVIPFIVSAQRLNVENGGKSAIVIAHFGTTYDDTRALTIDAINAGVKKAFPDCEVMEAYTSRIVISRLAKKGIEKHTPEQVLMKLAAEGYTHIILQGTFIIHGIESDNLIYAAEKFSPFFEEIRVGAPLLSSVEDCLQVVDILSDRHKELAGKGSDVLFVGHGTSNAVNAIYSQMDYMFKASGNRGFHVATVEGYPTIETAASLMKERKTKSVTIIPLMFVAGDHAKNDIDKEFKEHLESEGFVVGSLLEGLGQVPEIQELYVEHIRAALTRKPLSSVEIKTNFIKENIK